MIKLLNTPTDTTVIFANEEGQERSYHKVDAETSSIVAPADTKKIAFMNTHADVSEARIGDEIVRQPIAVASGDELDVAGILIPDVVHRDSSLAEQEKIPFHWMSGKLETLFQGNTDFKNSSIEGTYVRVMMLSTVVEASLRQVLDNHPTKDQSQVCPTCSKELPKLDAMINHLTSKGCSLFSSVFPSYATLDKNRLNALLHTIRIARNALVHRLEITACDLCEIESKFSTAFPAPYGETRWVKLDQMIVHAYAYLSNTLLRAAYRSRTIQLRNMRFSDYLTTYSDIEPNFVSCTVHISTEDRHRSNLTN